MELVGISKLIFSEPILSFKPEELMKLKPVRDPVRIYRGVRGKVADLAGKRSYGAESQNELRGLRIFVAGSTADVILEQPFSLEYMQSGKWRRYTPDVLLAKDGQCTVVEIKPDDIAKQPEAQEFFELVGRLLKQYGLHFRVWRQSEICKEPRLTNAAFLLNYRRHLPSPLERERLRRAIASHETVTLTTLSSLAEVKLESVLRVVLEGTLQINWWQLLDHQSMVSRQPIGPQIWPAGQVHTSSYTSIESQRNQTQ
jgi:hypothetical protein